MCARAFCGLTFWLGLIFHTAASLGPHRHSQQYGEKVVFSSLCPPCLVCSVSVCDPAGPSPGLYHFLRALILTYTKIRTSESDIAITHIFVQSFSV